MVAVIHSGSSLRNTLNYNENKVTQEVAQLIHSANYPKDTELLRFSDKINLLIRLAALNQQTKINSVHISLNFDPSEKLDTGKLTAIAEAYMQKIGFGKQPYLVYEHHDAGHPHIHIVTTNIDADGKRIALHNLGRNQSEKARKEIEESYGLVKAESKKQLHAHELKPINAQKVQYGRSETKRAITNVLDAVLPHYKYASLSELNAILQLYNVTAEPASNTSRTHLKKGLVYRILDLNRQKVGVPVKASRIHNKPTLKFLETKFKQNEPAKQSQKLRVRNLIDLSLMKKQDRSIEQLTSDLQKEKIAVVISRNTDGIIHGITYVDHHTKCVFNGSDLGNEYSANAVQQRCIGEQTTKIALQQSQHPAQSAEYLTSDSSPQGSKILHELLQPKQQSAQIASELREDKKRKRKRKTHH